MGVGQVKHLDPDLDDLYNRAQVSACSPGCVLGLCLDREEGFIPCCCGYFGFPGTLQCVGNGVVVASLLGTSAF